MTQPIKAGKTVALVAAGGLTLASSAVAANGKDEEFNKAETPELRLNQIGTPLNILQPPSQEFSGDFSGINYIDNYTSDVDDSGSKDNQTADNTAIDDTGGKSARSTRADGGGKGDASSLGEDQEYQTMFDTEGVIFAGDVKKAMDGQQPPHISFIISGIPNRSSQVFLAYSYETGDPASWQANFGQLKAGKIGLGMDFKILAGVQVEPETRFIQGAEFGAIERPTRSVLVDVSLKEIMNLDTDMIHFQALVLPAGAELDFASAQASEIDSFYIERPPKDDAGNYMADGGSKASAYNGNGVVKTKPEKRQRPPMYYDDMDDMNGGDMMPHDGQDMMPQDGQNMMPQDEQNMMPQDGQNMMPQDGQNMMPQDGQNMMPQDGQNMRPQV